MKLISGLFDNNNSVMRSCPEKKVLPIGTGGVKSSAIGTVDTSDALFKPFCFQKVILYF